MRRSRKPITAVRIRLAPVEGNHLMCVACGGFGSDLGIQAAGSLEPQAGIHRICVSSVKAKRAS